MSGVRKGAGGLIAFLSVAQIAFAITIIALVADQLWPGSGYYSGCYWDYSVDPPVETCGTWFSDGMCLMTDNSVNVCRYSYAAAAIGIVAAVVTLCAMCVPAALTLLMALFGSIWWLAYAITATVYSHNVDNQEWSLTVGPSTITIPYGYPRGNYRTMVYALAWTTFSCCVVILLLSLALVKGGEERKGAAQPAMAKAGMDEEPAKPVGMPPTAAAV